MNYTRLFTLPLQFQTHRKNVTFLKVITAMGILIFTSLSTFAQYNYQERTGLVLSEYDHSSLVENSSVVKKTAFELSDINFLSKALDGPSFSVTVNGSFAFVGTSTSLMIFNIFNPSQPMLIGHIHHAYTQLFDIYILGKYAYIALSSTLPWGEEGALEIIDISNIRNPVSVGIYKMPKLALSVFVSGVYAYVATGTELRIINVSNPANPAFVSSLDFGGLPNFTNYVEIVGNYAYVAATNAGLKIVDISNPTTPVEVSTYQTSSWARQVKVAGNIVYVLSAFGMGAGSLESVDISSRSNPKKIISIPVNSPGRMYTSAHFAYIAQQENGTPNGLKGGINIIDISDPKNLMQVGTNGNLDGGPFKVDGDDKLAFVASKEGGLIVVDVSNPTTPIYKSYYPTGGFTYSIQVVGNIAYVADRNPNWPNKGTVRTVDISNSSNPVELGIYQTHGETREIFVRQPYGYISEGLDGFEIADISNPQNIFNISRYKLTNVYVEAVSVVDNSAYLVCGDDTLRVLDISNQSLPSLMGKLSLGSGTQGRKIITKNNLAFISDLSGMTVLDISKPNAPVIRGNFATSTNVWQVYVNDNKAYVANWTSGLRIVDVTNPLQMKEIGGIKTLGAAVSVFVSNNYAYVGTGTQNGSVMGIEIIDISNPANLKKVGQYNLHDFAYDVFVNGNYIYVADGIGGLNILEFNPITSVKVNNVIPLKYKLAQNYPNPFNPTTKISYELPTNNFVTLKVYDVTGREVATLTNGWQDAGVHRIEFNGQNFSSGVYFYTIRAGEFLQSKKMLLMK